MKNVIFAVGFILILMAQVFWGLCKAKKKAINALPDAALTLQPGFTAAVQATGIDGIRHYQ